MITFFTIIFIFGLLIFVHEFGHYIVARRNRVKVEEFGFGFPPRIWGIKRGETLYSINLIPIGGFVRIFGEQGNHSDKKGSFASKSISVRTKILSAGVLMNILLAWLLFSIGYSIGMPPLGSPDYHNQKYVDTKIIIDEINEDSPAFDSLQKGDIVLGTKDSNFKSMTDMQSYSKDNAGRTVTLKVKRDEKEILIDVFSRENPPEGQGNFGITLLENTKVKYPVWKAPFIALYEVFRLIILIIAGLFTILKNLIINLTAPEGIAGPVGIYQITGRAVQTGWISALVWTAFLSINLAILNFLPIPALDGGRVLFIIIEKIRGKKVAQHVENFIHTIGFVLLILLVLLITYNDIIRIMRK